MPTSDKQHMTDPLRDWVRDTVVVHGVRGAARHIGIHHQTLVAILAGLNVRKGSLALARAAFESHRAATHES